MKKTILIVIISIIVSFIIIIVGFYLYLRSSTRPQKFKFSKNEMLSVNDSVENNESKIIIDSLSSLSASEREKGECVRIMITGVDARLGSNVLHADANHLLNIWLETGYIDIISIPRGTLANAGLADSLNQNYLANVRAVKGRERYLEAVKNIAEVDTINYYIEFGFSQAVGLMEMLGFGQKSISTLRVLRARKSFPQGDYQRCYNQGQFIRQMILKQFHNMNSEIGNLLISSALTIVETNLGITKAREIRDKLAKNGFASSKNDVRVRLKPRYDSVTDFNFADNKSLDSLHNLIVRRAPKDSTFSREKTSDEISQKMQRRLLELLNKAKSIENTNPKQLKSILENSYNQKAWLQITIGSARDTIKNEIRRLLKKSCSSNNEFQKVKEIENEIIAEKNAEIAIKPIEQLIWLPFIGKYRLILYKY